jgi:hypothetical protein
VPGRNTIAANELRPESGVVDSLRSREATVTRWNASRSLPAIQGAKDSDPGARTLRVGPTPTRGPAEASARASGKSSLRLAAVALAMARNLRRSPRERSSLFACDSTPTCLRGRAFPQIEGWKSARNPNDTRATGSRTRRAGGDGCFRAWGDPALIGATILAMIRCCRDGVGPALSRLLIRFPPSGAERFLNA